MKHYYYWHAMKDGELKHGMYTTSPLAGTAELARKLAKPIDADADAWALMEVEGNNINNPKAIIQIDYRDPEKNPVRWTYCGITAEAAVWKKLGFYEYTNHPFADNPGRHGYAPEDGDLVHARTMSGASDERALSWLIEAHTRSAEEKARVFATSKAADEAVHAARIQRQAALIRARVAKVEVELTDL